MEYEIKDLIGMLNLAVIIANGTDDNMIRIPKDAAIEIIVQLKTLEGIEGVLKSE